jgi:hypothetical protein
MFGEKTETEASRQFESEWLEQFFSYEHLPEDLAHVSQPFCEVAEWVIRTVPRNQERTVALRKLLEAKDAAVRALVADKNSRK